MGVVPWLPVCDDLSCRGNTQLAFTSLEPGFWRLKIRPRFCSSSARKSSSPSGRPVRSCARRAFNSFSDGAGQQTAPIGGHLQQRSDLHQVVSPLRVRGWNIWSVTSMPLKTKHLFTAHTSCVPVSSPRPRFQSSCVPVSSLPFPVPSCVPVSSPIYLAQPTQSVEQERANFPDLVLASPKRPSFQALGSAGLARVVRTIDLVVSGVFG